MPDAFDEIRVALGGDEGRVFEVVLGDVYLDVKGVLENLVSGL